MFKLLIFLNKTTEEKVIEHFNNFILKYLSDISGTKVLAGDVESNILLEHKYSKFCEATFDSKNDFDERMMSETGKAFSNDLMEFHKFITVILVNYEEK